jgi:hypothetical protein
MKVLLGIGAALFLLSSAQGQVVFYKQHIVLSHTSPGFHSRSLQKGWLLMDLISDRIAIVTVNKATHQFSIEFSQSDQLVEQSRNTSTLTTVIEQGSLSGLTMKGTIKSSSSGLSALASTTLHVAGASGDLKYHGNLIMDRVATLNNFEATPFEALQNVKNALFAEGYSQE